MPDQSRELYVISDLHIGGAADASAMCENPGMHGGDECGSPDRDRGFRINTHVAALTAFIDWVAAKPADGPAVELVLNGDVCDFLAEEGTGDEKWRPFIADPDDAVRTFDGIVERDRQVFDALGRVVSSGHQLTVLLGNHDVELSLPAVRERFEEAIGVTPSSKFRFVYDNEAYAIGPVLIEHGNRYDGWNTVDHDAVRRLRSMQSRRLALPEKFDVAPPAGSVMVADVINELKSSYAFVDLLKPETGAVVPILLALEPGVRKKLARVAPLAAKAAAHGQAAPAQPRFGGDIASTSTSASFGEDVVGGMGAAPAAKKDAGPDALATALAESLGDDESAAFLSGIDDDAGGGGDFGGDIASTAGEHSILGLAKLALWPAGRREKRLPALLAALCALQGDRSFELDGPVDDGYLEACERLMHEGGFTVIVFGHTHLARDRQIKPAEAGRGAGRYLNAGTWADLMQFPKEIVSGDRDAALEALGEFVDDLAQNQAGKWTMFRPSYVYVSLGADGAVASSEVRFWEGPPQ